MVRKLSSVSCVGIIVLDLASSISLLYYNFCAWNLLVFLGYSLEMVEKLKLFCRTREIESYVLSLGKLNEAKLSNHLDFDAYVLVGCPDNVLSEVPPY